MKLFTPTPKPSKRLSIIVPDTLLLKIQEWKARNPTKNFSAMIREYIRSLIEEK